MARKLEVEIVGDASSLKRALGQADSSSSKAGSSFGRLGKTAVLAGGAAGIGALVLGLKMGISEFTQSAKVAAQTNAVLKSTKGIANVTAKGVDSLATALMKKSGVDDEAIASGENMLLTFTKIRNEVGKGNDIFNQATKAALDFSVATGRDMTSASLMVGKALNDPLKGLTALGKAGVQFTDSQKDAIKAMVESGDTMGAQKIIMAELNKEFGGSAEALGKTLPGQINILKERFSNFAGMLVAKAIPAIQTAVAWFKDHWPEIQAKVQAMWAAVQPALVAFGDLVVTVVGLIDKHWGTIGPIVEGIGAIIKNTFEIITDIFRVFTALLKGDWSEAWGAFKDVITGVIDGIKLTLDLAKTALATVMKAIGKAMKDAIVTGITGVAGLVWDIINNIGSTITGALATIAGWGKSVGNAVKNAAVSGVTGIASDVWAVIDNIGGAIGKAASTIAGWGADIGGKLKEGAVKALSGIGQAIVNGVRAAVNALIGGVNRALEITIDTHIPKVGKVSINPPDIPNLAMGTKNFVGGLAIVGERGPELVGLPGGSSVTPNGSFGRPMIVNLQMDGRTMASLLVNPLRNEVQQLRRAGGEF